MTDDPAAHAGLPPRAAEMVRTLALQPHPEGCLYRELFRSPRPVRLRPDGPERSALTTIDVLLARGQVGPGFDFADFAFGCDDPALRAALDRLAPGLARLL